MKKILIVGGSGFLGSYLLEALQLRGLDRKCALFYTVFTENKKKYQTVRATEIHCDLTECESVSKIISDILPDVVVNFAVKYPTQAPYEEVFNVNVTGTKNIIDACEKYNINVFIQASSVAVYGDRKVCHEEESMHPKDYYGQCKAHAEEIVMSSNLSWYILRIFNVYGYWEKSEHIVSKIFRSFAEGKDLFCGDLTKRRDFIYVKDVIDFTLRCIQGTVIPNNIFNVGCGDVISGKEVLRTFELFFSRTVVIHEKEEFKRAYDPEILQASTQKLEEVAKWKPSYTLEMAIRDMIRIYNAKTLAENITTSHGPS